ncbi:MAG: hypothetical protein AVDCRST_MAG61-1929, partial [uncultured Friedmanniella sp.]
VRHVRPHEPGHRHELGAFPGRRHARRRDSDGPSFPPGEGAGPASGLPRGRTVARGCVPHRGSGRGPGRRYRRRPDDRDLRREPGAVAVQVAGVPLGLRLLDRAGDADRPAGPRTRRVAGDSHGTRRLPGRLDHAGAAAERLVRLSDRRRPRARGTPGGLRQHGDDVGDPGVHRTRNRRTGARAAVGDGDAVAGRAGALVGVGRRRGGVRRLHDLQRHVAGHGRGDGVPGDSLPGSRRGDGPGPPGRL